MSVLIFGRLRLRGISTVALGLLALLLGASALRGQSITITLSQVGNPDNAADSTGYGSVDYDYDIGSLDVTIAQYCAFLNAVAKSDPYGIYDDSMTDMGNLSNSIGVAGIMQSGSPGSYSYTVINGSQNDPATWVSLLDAMRFCNWLQNGQPTTGVENASTTEGGAYTLNGDTTSGLETKNPSAKWWIPSEDEWYKAAYYDPQLNGGLGGYYTYATQSNTTPGNNYLDPGIPNQANYKNGVYSVTQNGTSYDATQNYLTPVGAFSNSASYYRTYDQSGDAFNWSDTLVDSEGSLSPVLRGGDWAAPAVGLSSSYSTAVYPTFESNYLGFRVASIPEPNSLMLVLAGVGGLALISHHRRSNPNSYFSTSEGGR